MNKINIAFAGCGFLGLYQTGVVAALSSHGRGFLSKVDRISGASAGSLHATMLVCDSPIDKSLSMVLRAACKVRTNIHKIPWQNLDSEVRLGLDEVLCDDAHKLASSKLYISVTSLEAPVNISNKLVSNFESRVELIDTLAQSCFIPFYSGWSPPRQGKEWIIDGAYTSNLPLFDGFENVKVSPFASADAEISPEKKENQFEIVYKDMPYAMTYSNVKRLWSVVVPPSNDGMKELYLSGYKDGKLFLKKRGVFEAAPMPDVLHLFDQDYSSYSTS